LRPGPGRAPIRDRGNDRTPPPRPLTLGPRPLTLDPRLPMRLLLAAVLALAATSAAAQPAPPFADKRIPAEPGFRVYLIADMEGMGSTVLGTEVIGGTEGPAYRDRGGRDYWEHYRGLLTE